MLLGLAVRDGFSLLWDRRPSVYTPYPCRYSPPPTAPTGSPLALLLGNLWRLSSTQFSGPEQEAAAIRVGPGHVGLGLGKIFPL